MTESAWDDRTLQPGHPAADAAAGETCDRSGRGFVEILVYATGDHRLVLALDGSGMPRVNLSFQSGEELGDFVAELLAVGETFRNPVLTALRQAARRLPPQD